MSVESPFSEIFLANMERVSTEVPEIAHIDQNFGQLEGYSTRPAVQFPCILFDFKNWIFSGDGDNSQIAERDVEVTLGWAQYTPGSNAMEKVYKEEALKFYEMELKVHKALQGWSPGDNCGYLTRSSTDTFNRAMGVRVRVIRYRLEFEDYSAQPEHNKIPKPPLEFGADQFS